MRDPWCSYCLAEVNPADTVWMEQILVPEAMHRGVEGVNVIYLHPACAEALGVELRERGYGDE